MSLHRDLASKVHEFRLHNREFHAPWTPLRSELYFDKVAIHQQLALEEQQIAKKQHIRFALLLPENNNIIGFVNFNNIVFGAFQSCHVGYSLDERHLGQGYMREGLSRGIQYMFDKVGLHRLEANIMPRNTASIRVVEKLGFEREGYMRKYLRIHGVWEDHLQFVMFND